MTFHKASHGEYDAIRSFYYEVIDAAADSEYHPEWKRDIYPSPGQIRTLIEKGELFVGTENGAAVCIFALNHECNTEYSRVRWRVTAERDEIFVIHILAVHPDFTRRGKAKEAVEYAVGYARSHGGRAVRLDVIKGNIPANRLYESAGFRKLDTVTMFYPDTGFKEFELYELELQSVSPPLRQTGR